MKNRYVFDAVLDGFINVHEDSGKYNNRSFSFRLPADVLEQAEADREELLTWAKSKVDNPKRVAINPAKWDEEGLVKYSYGGETNRVEPVFVDAAGDPVEQPVLRDVRKGTKVRLIVQQSPYTKPSLGTTLKVLGVQIIELVTGSGALDSGTLSAADVSSIFGEVPGYRASSPAVRRVESEAESYDF
jgi:hypothetical protein